MWEAPHAMLSLLWQDPNVMSPHVFSEHGVTAHMYFCHILTFHFLTEKCFSVVLKKHNRKEETFFSGNRVSTTTAVWLKLILSEITI